MSVSRTISCSIQLLIHKIFIEVLFSIKKPISKYELTHDDQKRINLDYNL